MYKHFYLKFKILSFSKRSLIQKRLGITFDLQKPVLSKTWVWVSKLQINSGSFLNEGKGNDNVTDIMQEKSLDTGKCPNFRGEKQRGKGHNV